MSGRGRPLRFLALLLTGWTGVRVALLWPRIDSVPALIDAVIPGAAAREMPSLMPWRPLAADRPAGRLRSRSATPTAPARRAPIDPVSDPERVALALASFASMGDPVGDEPTGGQAGVPRPLPPEPLPTRSRWSGSAWLLARGGSGIAPGLVGGQLGGSQAGLRVAYAVTQDRRLAIAGRVTTPLGRGLRETALGLEWQPTRAPVRLVAEYRVPLGRGKAGPAVGVVGGFGPVDLGGVTADAYGQAGVIDRGRREGFADGAAHLRRPLGTLGEVRFDLGAGVWGAAQRGASRLDLGPSLGAVLPLGATPVRVSLDWRQRIAGDARPGSGLALTLGADF